jgi:hypothetical protein
MPRIILSTRLEALSVKTCLSSLFERQHRLDWSPLKKHVIDSEGLLERRHVSAVDHNRVVYTVATVLATLLSPSLLQDMWHLAYGIVSSRPRHLELGFTPLRLLERLPLFSASSIELQYGHRFWTLNLLDSISGLACLLVSTAKRIAKVGSDLKDHGHFVCGAAKFCLHP